MGWGDIRRGLRRARVTWTPAERNAAIAVCAAQIAVLASVAWVRTFDDDDYGRAYDGVLGPLFVLLLTPLLLPVLGMLHAALHTMPAVTLGRLTARRAPGPEGVWQAVFVVALGAVWTCVIVAGTDLPGLVVLLQLVGVVSAFAVLPVLGVAHVRRRELDTGELWSASRVWFRAGLGGAGLCVTLVGGALVAQETGLYPMYEPPELSAERVLGAWQGRDSSELRLKDGFLAEVTTLAAGPAGGDDAAYPPYEECDGTGTWAFDDEGEQGPTGRAGVVVRIDGACGQDTYWTIGGTDAEPELFARFGDPDDEELWILRQP